jgi:hypothetical protein
MKRPVQIVVRCSSKSTFDLLQREGHNNGCDAAVATSRLLKRQVLRIALIKEL